MEILFWHCSIIKLCPLSHFDEKYFFLQGGGVILALMDYIVGKFITLPLLITEIFAIMMVYGFPRIISDIEFMLPFVKLRKAFWKFCWVVTFPILIGLFGGFLSSAEGPEYKDKSLPFSTSCKFLTASSLSRSYTFVFVFLLLLFLFFCHFSISKLKLEIFSFF